MCRCHSGRVDQWDIQEQQAIAAEVRTEQGYTWARYAIDALFAGGLALVLLVYLLPTLEGRGFDVFVAVGVVGALLSLVLVPSRREHSLRFLIVLIVVGGYLTAISALPALIFLAPIGLFCLEAYGADDWVRRWLVPGIAVVNLAWLALVSPAGVTVVGVVAMVSILGWARGVRAQRRYRQSRMDRIAVAHRERDLRTEQAVAAERTRIARDIHDLVSHSLAVVAVQAAGAERIADADPQRAKEALGVISTTARDALAEMRGMLEVLRSGGESNNSHQPSPGVEALEPLAQSMSDRGLVVGFESVGNPYPMPPGAELALYRVVQEALTNVVKHADIAAGAELSVEYGARELSVSVVSHVLRADHEPRVPGAGSGQLGMRERLALYGGSLHVGQSGGQYLVRAVVPRPSEGGLQ